MAKMNKKEFLDQLRMALTGEVPQGEIINQIQYYDNYIKQESINKREELVVEDLGSPLLIGKTIIDAYERTYGPVKGRGMEDTYSGQRHPNMGSSANNYRDYNRDSKSFNKKTNKRNIFHIPWYVKLSSLLIMIIIISAIVLFSSILIKIILNLLPIILITILIISFINLFKKQQ